MRIKAPFATDRISNNILYKPKFFLASEGSKSEPKYFEGLNQSIISENVTISGGVVEVKSDRGVAYGIYLSLIHI